MGLELSACVYVTISGTKSTRLSLTLMYFRFAMPPTSEKERGSNDVKLEDYKYKYYKELSRGSIKVKISSSAYRCPYCHGKKDYHFEDLLQHANSLGRVSQRIDLEERAQHLALEKYMNRHFNVKERSVYGTKTESSSAQTRDRDHFIFSPTHMSGDTDWKKSPMNVTKTESSPVHKRDRDHLISSPKYMSRHIDVRKHSGYATKTESSHVHKHNRDYLVVSPPLHEKGKDQLLVWPWMGIVANIQTRFQDGRRVGESGAKLRDELTRKGFETIRVHPLWNHLGHSGFAIVDFKKDWDGFRNALMFEKDYEVNNCGKKEYFKPPLKGRGDKLYGWIAREDDYNSRSIIGDHLRRNGDLKSVSGKEIEDRRKDSKLLTKLTDTLQMNRERLKEMEVKYNETSVSLNKLMEEKDAIIRAYNEGMIIFSVFTFKAANKATTSGI